MQRKAAEREGKSDLSLVSPSAPRCCTSRQNPPRLSTVYKNYHNVLYGLMNEPNIQSPTQWKATALAAINAILAVSTSQTILIPSTYFTTAATWTRNGNSAAWTGYRDPAGGPFMFEMHQYLDQNYSGMSSTCVPGSGSSVLTDATAWLAANGYKALLGEFDWYNDFGQSGGVVSPQCQAEGTALLHAMQFSPSSPPINGRAGHGGAPGHGRGTMGSIWTPARMATPAISRRRRRSSRC